MVGTYSRVMSAYVSLCHSLGQEGRRQHPSVSIEDTLSMTQRLPTRPHPLEGPDTSQERHPRVQAFSTQAPRSIHDPNYSTIE